MANFSAPVLLRTARMAASCSAATLLLAACVKHQDAARVYSEAHRVSIKDSPQIGPQIGPQSGAQPKARVVRVAVKAAPPTASKTHIRSADAQPTESRPSEPAFVKVAKRLAPSAEGTTAADKTPVPVVKSAEAVVRSAPAAPVQPEPAQKSVVASATSTTPPQAQVVPSPLASVAPPKPAETPQPPATSRPMTEIRQAAAIEQKPEAKAEPKPDPRPEAKAEPKPTPAPAQPVVRAPVQQAVQVPATVVAAPQAAAVVDDQRVAKGLALAADYMQSGRVVNARSLLEDLAKSGNPTVLATLAESYDPLHLRSTYPKLFRTGSFAKALDAYERAKAAGAKGMEPRIEAVRAVMNARP